MTLANFLLGRSPSSTKHHRRPTATADDGRVSMEEMSLDEIRRRRTGYYHTASERSKRPSDAIGKTTASNSSDLRKAGVRSDKKHSTYSRDRNIDCVYGRQPLQDDSSDTEVIDEDIQSLTDDTRTQGLSSRRSTTSANASSTTHRSEQKQTHSKQRSAKHAARRSRTTSQGLSSIREKRDDRGVHSPSSAQDHLPSSVRASPTRRHSTTSVPTSPTLVDCLTCGSDDIPPAQSAQLECGHRMCHDCLRRIFELSIKDPTHMPPKCCTTKHIPLKYVDKLFDAKFKKHWNRKYQEYHTKNRLYCPTAQCGKWIKPSHVQTDHRGRRHALCPRCKTKVCMHCGNKLHKARECPKDPEIAQLMSQAKREGWQRCYECHAMVERKEGCNHMTCRCKAEFCIMCGAKWKTCECPWFAPGAVPEVEEQDGDQLHHMRVPEPVHAIDWDGPVELGREALRAFISPRYAFLQPPLEQRAYRHELAARRRQEREDAALAYRLQMAAIEDSTDEEEEEEDEEHFHTQQDADADFNDDDQIGTDPFAGEYFQHGNGFSIGLFEYGLRQRDISARRRRRTFGNWMDGDDAL